MAENHSKYCPSGTWEENDKQHYDGACYHKFGQINNCELSNWIKKLCEKPCNKIILEVGTWNGCGSTRVFINSLLNCNKDWQFYSLECNPEKSKYARDLYNHKNVHILNECLWTGDLPEQILHIHPVLEDNELYQIWHTTDMDNMKKCKQHMTLDFYDIIFLDGGEFTTYNDYLVIKDICKYLILDDTKTDKCKKIVEELMMDNTWDLIHEDKETRNGFHIFLKNL